MGIKEKISLSNENADKFADGRRLYCFFISSIEKAVFQNPVVDFWSFQLYKKTFYERRKYLSRKDSYYLISLNDPDESYLHDKEKFNAVFKDKVGRDWLFVAHSYYEDFEEFCKKHPTFLVKANWANQGTGIYKYTIDENSNLNELFKKFSDEYVMIEEIIIQHKEMSRFNSSSVNTVRVATVFHNNKVNIVATALRMGNGGIVDNLHGGGVCAAVDIKTGIVKSLGYDGNGNEYLKHPATGTIIPGFQIPNWDKVLSTVTEAAQRVPQYKWVGWDVAVTVDGAVLIEGNHDQGIDLIQIGNKGLKPDIKAILKS